MTQPEDKQATPVGDAIHERLQSAGGFPSGMVVAGGAEDLSEAEIAKYEANPGVWFGIESYFVIGMKKEDAARLLSEVKRRRAEEGALLARLREVLGKPHPARAALKDLQSTKEEGGGPDARGSHAAIPGEVTSGVASQQGAAPAQQDDDLFCSDDGPAYEAQIETLQAAYLEEQKQHAETKAKLASALASGWLAGREAVAREFDDTLPRTAAEIRALVPPSGPSAQPLTPPDGEK